MPNPADRRAAHKAKMARKFYARADWYARNGNCTSFPIINRNGRLIETFPASINRHTGKPHEHRAEIARRVRQAA